LYVIQFESVLHNTMPILIAVLASCTISTCPRQWYVQQIALWYCL